MRLAAFISTLSTLCVACSTGGGEGVCRVGADCASGVCQEDGTCAPVDDAGTADAGPDSGLVPDADPSLCQPNHDYVVTRGEVTLAAGLAATYRVALDVPVSTAGATLQDGTREWSLAGALAGDHSLLIETLPLAGQWYAASFAGATYAARLSDENDLYGVFEVTGDALLLRGVVSPQGGGTRTELSYDPPVRVLQFPLGIGASWETTSTVTGVTSGIASLVTETYESSVDARGALDTPFGRFPEVVRVNVKLTRTLGVVQTVLRTHAYVAECYGTIATVRSQDNQSAAEFGEAAEVRRFAP